MGWFIFEFREDDVYGEIVNFFWDDNDVVGRFGIIYKMFIHNFINRLFFFIR